MNYSNINYNPPCNWPQWSAALREELAARGYPHPAVQVSARGRTKVMVWAQVGLALTVRIIAVPDGCTVRTAADLIAARLMAERMAELTVHLGR